MKKGLHTELKICFGKYVLGKGKISEVNFTHSCIFVVLGPGLTGPLSMKYKILSCNFLAQMSLKNSAHSIQLVLR